MNFDWLLIGHVCLYICVLTLLGGLTQDQLAALEAGGGAPTATAATGDASGHPQGATDTHGAAGDNAASAHVVPESLNSQPCCPWFVCCY